MHARRGCSTILYQREFLRCQAGTASLSGSRGSVRASAAHRRGLDRSAPAGKETRGTAARGRPGVAAADQAAHALAATAVPTLSCHARLPRAAGSRVASRLPPPHVRRVLEASWVSGVMRAPFRRGHPPFRPYLLVMAWRRRPMLSTLTFRRAGCFSADANRVGREGRSGHHSADALVLEAVSLRARACPCVSAWILQSSFDTRTKRQTGVRSNG